MKSLLKNWIAPLSLSIAAVAYLECAGRAFAQHAPPGLAERDYAPGELIVKFKTDASDAQLADVIERARSKKAKHLTERRGRLEGLMLIETDLHTEAGFDR
jgi:hypothetical protein